jgi:hypothetical protein
MARNLTTGLQRGLRRSIAGGLGANDLFSTAPLDLRFAQQKTLDPRVTFTRQSRATYVDSEGVIRTATTNLFLQSNGFDTTWTNANSSETSASGIAPDGSNTAWLLQDTLDGSASVHNISQTISFNSGTAYTFSLYAKANSIEGMHWLLPSAAFGVDTRANYDLINGTTAVTAGTATAAIQNAGGGWYRCIITATATASASSGIQIRTMKIVSGSLSSFYQGDGTGTILIWGAQLEPSTTVGEYIPTTSTINSAPRFDHDPTTGESLGLLMEESRQNLLLQSEDFSTTWTNGESSENINVAVAPNGTTTADALVDTVNNSPHSVSQNVAGCAGSTSYTFSCYMKKGSKDFGSLIFGPNASWETGGGASVFFDLTNGTISASTSATGTIQALPNGWYRCTATATTVASPGTVFMRIGSSLTGSAQTYEGNGDEAIYLWGAQLEAGSFPTSYIPTTTAEATRAADVASISGSNFSSWFSPTAGVMYSDWTVASNGSRAFHMEDTSRTNTERFGHRVIGNYAAAEVSSNGVFTSVNAISAGTISAYPTRIKSCVGYDSSSAVVAFRGAVNSTATANGSPEPGEMLIGSYRGSATFANGPIARLTYWPQRLPDDTLQTITV